MSTEKYDRQRFLGALINIVAFRMRHKFDLRLREYGLDISVWPVLACLWEQDGVPQARIGELLGVPGYAMSRGVDRLEGAGLVTRRSDPENRRVRRVFLTEAGRAIESTLVPLANAVNEEMLAPLAPAQQNALLALLRQLVEHTDGSSGIQSPA